MYNKKNIKINLFAAAVLISVCFLLNGCGGANAPESMQVTDKDRISDTSIFSWEGEYINAENEDTVSAVMSALGCKAIYQEIPDDADKDTVLDFLNRRNKEGQLVYYLAGKSEWGIEKDAASMLAAVEAAREWNALAGTGAGFEGIVFDVEPYLLAEWKEDKSGVMRRYVTNCIKAYDLAQRNGLKVILCIPNFYDSTGLETELERLIQYGCDAAAVMNYNKTDEWGQILLEAKFAQEYEKGIINITELQRPGVHSLEENNTYYNDGLQAVRQSWDEISEKFSYEKLGFSWHYLKPAIELLEREGQL